MKDMRQITLILGALKREKKRILSQLAKTNLQIQNKSRVIAKIMRYQDEYQDEKIFSITRRIPALQQNFQTFCKNINRLIIVEETEVNRLTAIASTTMQKIQEVDKKIKLMDMFAHRLKENKVRLLNKEEQLQLNDLSNFLKTEQNHD